MPNLFCNRLMHLLVALLVLATSAPAIALAADPWVVYEGTAGPGVGKHIVLVSGDEEYRSEEALPLLGQILAARHGFKTTVLFSIDPDSGEIDPGRNDNIPGLEALDSADLLVVFTRFRNLPDDQMAHLDAYLKSGKPVLGIRTATHGFNIPEGEKYRRWSYDSSDESFKQGFGQQVLGETWVNHHGHHGHESTRGILVPEVKDHAILRGIKDGDIWGDTDVYTVDLPMPESTLPLVYGQVLTGMNFDDEPVSGRKNDPMMPIAWLNKYEYDGAKGKAFCSTLGAATDLATPGSRRLLVNAAYYLLGMDVPVDGTNVDMLGEYKPTKFGFGGNKKGVKPEQLAWADNATPVAVATSGQDLELNKGDHICILGGTLAERMQHFGWLEARLQSRFADKELVFRNLGYSADEIDGWRNFSHRLRSMDFGSQDQWLAGDAPVPQVDKLSPRDQGKVNENRFLNTNTKADVIFAFFGYNESFAGEAGLDEFKKNVAEFIEHTKSQKYNGKSAPKLVLFSPIGMEHVLDPNLPTPDQVAATNKNIKLYADAMERVAKEHGVMFISIYDVTLGDREPGKSLTINGVHQTEMGDALIAAAIEHGLFPNGPMIKRDAEALEAIRQAVLNKDFFWFNRYRATDGFSTYGERAFLKFSEGPGGYGDGLSNYSVVQRELDVLDLLTAEGDRAIWAVAQGKPGTHEAAKLPEFIPVVSNKPGPLEGGKHLYLSGEDAIQKMTPGPDLKVELVADESMFPEMVNPVQMSFDAKGRLWVACWRTYPHWKPTEEMNDKLLILEDTNGDGRSDKCLTFAGDLHNPTGFEFWNGGVLVAQGPDLLFLKDTDGDDKYDVKERVVHGLDTADTHHTANSFVLDPGGALYCQEGTFHHTQVETAWQSPRRVANGAVFRYEPRAQKFGIYVSYGFANPHGHIFDRWGQDVVWDGTGSQPYHGIMFSGDLDFPHKHAGPPQVYQQRTRPTSGCEVLSSAHFPEEYQGNLLVLNVIGFQGILRYRVEDDGASFKGIEQDPILSSSDANFRPADIEMGPDGAIYFTDWQNPIIGHMQHNLRDPSRDQEHGRVYRVRHVSRDLSKPAKIAGEPIVTLLELLKSPEDRVRYRTRIELGGRPTSEVIPALEKWLANLNTSDANYEHHRLEGLWLHQNHNVVNEELLKQVLASPDFRARAAAIRVLVPWRDRLSNSLDLLSAAVNDEHPRVRLLGVWALSYYSGKDAPRAAEIAVEALLHPDDQFITHVLNETNKTLERRTAK
jgi:glucose/arabinose dehydrogenase